MDSLVLRTVDFTSAKDWSYGAVPKRLAYLSDRIEGAVDDSTYTAYQRLKALHDYMPMVYTDMYRDAVGSAKAYETKKGAQKPGFSAHNYGVAIDIAVDATMKRHKVNYNQLVHTLISFGWTPYQGVSQSGLYKRETEDWHFNFIGDYGYRPWNPGTSQRGQQALAWIDNYLFNSPIVKIHDMLNELNYNSLTEFKQKHLSPKLQKLNESVIERMLYIYTCKVFDENQNQIGE